MKTCLKTIINFYKKNNYENILKLTVLFANTINLFFLIDTKYCLPITIFIFAIYFYKSTIKITEKKKIILTMG